MSNQNQLEASDAVQVEAEILKVPFMPWLAFVKIEQLPEDYKLMTRVIGLRQTILMAFKMPGIHIYLKKPDKLFLAAKMEYIRDCYAKSGAENPFNVRQVALNAQVTERFVYDTIGKEPKGMDRKGIKA